MRPAVHMDSGWGFAEDIRSDRVGDAYGDLVIWIKCNLDCEEFVFVKLMFMV